MEGANVGDAAASHERAHRVHVPHILQRAATDEPSGDAGKCPVTAR